MNIEHNAALQEYNTFGINVHAEALAHAYTVQDVQEAILLSHDYAGLRIIGGGSNILFRADVDGLLLHVALQGIEIINETPDSVLVDIAAGEQWDDVVRYCVERSWGGVENLSLIPGTAGAAPVQNIGAYGVELSDVLVSVEGISVQTRQRQTLQAKDCALGYRTSIFKQALRNDFIITSIRLQLSKHTRPEQLYVSYGALQQELAAVPVHQRTIADVSAAVRRIRQSKLPDPRQLGNAGSFFRNPEISREHFLTLQQKYPDIPSFPVGRTFKDTCYEALPLVKVPAGWLIERCGWKGKRCGDAGVYPLQALVLVNYGGASGEELYNLALAIQHSVHERFAITLEAEVNIW
jgi:UDP-N-acetylmuramate dehydrogenase